MNDRPILFAPHAFSSPDAVASSLAPDVAASLLASAGDISLVIDSGGVIRDIAISNADLVAQGFGDWIGQTWLDTVTTESTAKVAQMLADSAGVEPARWRQVNHPTHGGDVPVRYLVMQLSQGGAIAIGRDMRATAAMQQRLLQTQQSLERDYIKLRQAEARYRLLFDLGTEPVLIVDAASRRVREINPAA
ncbi:MAG: transcriptional regulator PpsR, partial [Sphingomonas sp.]